MNKTTITKMCEYKFLAKNIKFDPLKNINNHNHTYDHKKQYIVLTTDKMSIDLKLNNVPAFFHIINHAADLMIDVVMIVNIEFEKDMTKLLNEQKLDVKFSTRLNEKIFRYKNINVFVQIVKGHSDSMSEYFSTKNGRIQENDMIIVLKPNTPLVTKNTIKKMFDIISGFRSVDGVDDGVNPSTDILVLESGIGKDNSRPSELKNLIDLDNYTVCGFREKKIFENILLNSSITTTATTTKIPKLKKYLSKECFDETMSLSKTSILPGILPGILTDDIKQLQMEYMKKFTIEHIDKSSSNITNTNLTRLIKILNQLSPVKKSVSQTPESLDRRLLSVDKKSLESSDDSVSMELDSCPDILTLNKLRTHIKDVTSIIVNKKYLIVVKYEDMIVGTGSILIEDKIIHNMGTVGHIEDIVIDKSYRGIGLANLLMIKLIDLAKQHKCYKIILDASNDVAPFYEKFGFKIHANSMRKDL
jgi:hypothetical protein